MKQSIQLRLGQHLTMTPQLQQAIRLLQLSSLELQLEVQQALESNLMLESEDLEQHDENSSQELSADSPGTGDSGTPESEPEVAGADETIPDELPVDTQWDEIYDSGLTSFSGPNDADQRDFFETHDSGPDSLYEHLIWQMELTPFSPTDQAIAGAIIDAINDDGYLSLPLEDIHQGLLPDHDIEFDEMEAVLHRIQHFDPVGVGARDPRECLLIQLNQLSSDTPWRAQALELVENQLDTLASRDYGQLMRRLKLSTEELQNVIHLIQSLDPRPGSRITSEAAPYVIPDVYVSKVNDKWRIELNPESAPRLRINAQYAGLVRRADNSDDNNYLRNHLQEARWFLKSLQSRNETLLKVASCIVERQKEFLDEGDEAMKPLVLRDVAEIVDMHESTISRVTTQKYMHTPRGIFEFKYFFSSHVGTSDGGECSATAIRAMIRKLIADETPMKPLSDSKIAAILAEEGIKVARRTIAKYREAMTIPPSNERKRLA